MASFTFSGNRESVHCLEPNGETILATGGTLLQGKEIGVFIVIVSSLSGPNATLRLFTM